MYFGLYLQYSNVIILNYATVEPLKALLYGASDSSWPATRQISFETVKALSKNSPSPQSLMLDHLLMQIQIP